MLTRAVHSRAPGCHNQSAGPAVWDLKFCCSQVPSKTPKAIPDGQQYMWISVRSGLIERRLRTGGFVKPIAPWLAAALLLALPVAALAQYYQTDFPAEEFKARHAPVFE